MWSRGNVSGRRDRRVEITADKGRLEDVRGGGEQQRGQRHERVLTLIGRRARWRGERCWASAGTLGSSTWAQYSFNELLLEAHIEKFGT